MALDRHFADVWREYLHVTLGTLAGVLTSKNPKRSMHCSTLISKVVDFMSVSTNLKTYDDRGQQFK
jgi:hypothetical protein